MAQDAAITKALKTIDRKRRVMRDLVGEIELAKPAVTKMQLDLFAEAALVPNTVAVTHNQHPDHQFRIDRRSTNIAVTSPSTFSTASVKLCRLTLPVECPLSLPITRKLPFRFRPTPVVWARLSKVRLGVASGQAGGLPSVRFRPLARCYPHLSYHPIASVFTGA